MITKANLEYAGNSLELYIVITILKRIVISENYKDWTISRDKPKYLYMVSPQRLPIGILQR